MADSNSNLYTRAIRGDLAPATLLGQNLHDIATAFESTTQRAHGARSRADAYGGFVLCLGDRDLSPAGPARYEKATVGWIWKATPPVEALKRDLETAGFGAILRMNGAAIAYSSFDLATHFAVRELQIAAGMPRLLLRDGLQYAPNPARYTGPVSGVLNAETARALRAWVTKGLRNPVRCLIPSQGNAEVFWDTDAPNGAEVVLQEPGDLYGPYVPDSHRPDGSATWRIGHRVDVSGYVGGPVVGTDESWPECAMTIASLTGLGADFAALTDPTLRDAARSTWRILHAVALRENAGRFDILNGWDPGVISTGLFHFTLVLLATEPVGNTSKTVLSSGELVALLAILAQRNPTEYQRCLGRYGLMLQGFTRRDATWARPGEPAGAGFLESANGTWRGGLRMRDESDSFPLTTRVGSLAVTSTSASAWARYLRSWPWFARFVMASRCSVTLQRAQWDLARMRMRALAQRTWADGLTVGQVFHSELAFGMLLRVHVNKPGILDDLRDNMGYDWDNNGTEARQIELATRMKNNTSGDLQKSLTLLYDHAYRIPKKKNRPLLLSPAPNSLSIFDQGL